jgi:hypothetical protein
MPFLVSDPPVPSDNVSYYTIVGLPGNPTAPVDPTGQYGVKYDVTDVPPGTYSLMVSACNAWECSLPAPFDFTRPNAPTSPVGLRIL